MNEFVMEHPKKVEIANKILSFRQDKKCITFSQRSSTANKIKYGETITSKMKQSNKDSILERFCNMEKGVLNSVRVLDEGKDIPGANMFIILSNSSAKRQKVQRIGRSVRTDNNSEKVTEGFSLVLRNTSEENWFNRSASLKKYIEITEDELDLVLGNEKEKIEYNKYNFLTLF